MDPVERTEMREKYNIMYQQWVSVRDSLRPDIQKQGDAVFIELDAFIGGVQ